MTDDVSTAVSAEQSSAPSNEPVSTETARHDALETTAKSLESSIDNAFDKVFSDDTEQKKQAVARDEKGRFAGGTTEAAQPVAATPEAAQKPEAQPAQAASPVDVPARFSPDAKAAWATTPEPVKAEINRAVSELEKGIADYQARYAPLKPYEDMAKQHNTTIEAALTNYVNMENMLSQNPVAAFGKICEFIGKTPQQFMAEIAGYQQQEAQIDPVVASLRQQVETLQQQLSGVSTTIQSQKEAELEQQIQAWAADKPRFNELRATMAQLATSGMATDLDDAYAKASRLIPATAPVAAQVQPKPDLKAQTQKGQLSTTGAPVSGSNPAYRKPASSASEAIDRAFAQFGLG